MAYIDRDKLLNELPNDLPYKASVKRVLIQAEEADVVEVRHGKRIEQLCDDMTLKFIVLMARSGKTDFPEFKELEEIIEELPLRERVIAREHYLKGLKIPELVKSYGYSERQVLRIIASAKELMRRSDT